MRGAGRVFLGKWRDKTGKLRKCRVWTLEFSLHGVQHRESSGTRDRRNAVELLRLRVGDVRAGHAAANPQKVSLRQLRGGLVQHYENQGNRSTRRMLQAWEHLEAFFPEGTAALAVSRARVTDYIAARLKAGAARNTINYEIAVLNSAFAVAVNTDVLSVRPGFKSLARPQVRLQFFEPGEWAALVVSLGELKPDIVPLVRALYLTGWRSSELRLAMFDQNVNWEAEELRLDASQAKNKAARSFPFKFAAELKALLEERWKHRNGPYIFQVDGRPWTKGELWYWWRRGCKRAGIVAKTPHTLRKTRARLLRLAGLDDATTMALLGWRDVKILHTFYSAVSDADKHEAVRKAFSSRVEGVES